MTGIGIIGATGAVGQEMYSVLKTRKFPYTKILLFASSSSVGNTNSDGITFLPFSLDVVRELDIVFLAVSGTFSLEFAQAISENGGPIVIDNSSAWRMDPQVPLIIPEINAHMIGKARLIANPNCTTAIAAMALWPLHCTYGIKKIIMSTYQAASGAGAKVSCKKIKI